MRWRVKKLSIGGGGAWGIGRTVQIASWKSNFSIYLDIQVYYLDIQAITTLLCLQLVLYVLVPSIYSFSILQLFSWKVTFSGSQKPTPPTVFNLQASDWVHCEEETGAHYQLSLLKKRIINFMEFFEMHKFFGKITNWNLVKNFFY